MRHSFADSPLERLVFFKADSQWKCVFVTEAKCIMEPKNKVSWVNPTFQSSPRYETVAQERITKLRVGPFRH